ncbi:MAG: DUF4159 domain-containing protein [Gemmataceae bacterium]|nr:DUF4159 domain-containing protein [Gemmataceae bacterium]
MWKVRREGSPEHVETPFVLLAQGLMDGDWDPTDEVMGPGETAWVRIEEHPALAEIAEEMEPPPPPHHEDEAHLDFNALIDVCMVMLIFFILTTSVAAMQKQMEAPTLDRNKPGPKVVTKEQVEATMIHVAAKMQAGEPVVLVEGEETPIARLAAKLKGLIKAEKTTVLLEHDDQVPHDVVLQIMDKAKLARVRSVQMLVPCRSPSRRRRRPDRAYWTVGKAITGGRSMKRSLALLLLALATPLLLRGAPDKPADGAAVAGDDDLVASVKKSLESGKQWLLKAQRDNGAWEGSEGQPGGRSALALLALLNAGVPADHKAVKSGLAYLRSLEPVETYVVSLQTMVFCLVGHKDDAKRIERNIAWLESALLENGWGYRKGDGMQDGSNSQYALLALHEAILAGHKVDQKTLAKVQAIFKRIQAKDGRWNYQAKANDKLITMTTAGLCNLLIAGMDLARGKGKLDKDGIDSECGKYDDETAVARGLAWLGDHFPAEIGPGSMHLMRNAPYYALYGIERAGRISGQRFFGGHDWYEVGCRWLVAQQKADGQWQGGGHFENSPGIATSFALLFLSKGRTPVLVSKLAYNAPDGMDWNNKRSDVKHLAEFCSRALFKNQPLAWQAFDVRAFDAGTDDSHRKLAAQLLQSPVVYFNGHSMAPRGKEAGVLKHYLENGGFLLAENCCGAKKHPKFDADFRRLMRDLFPDAKLEPLEAEHPIWLASGKYASSPKEFPLEGIKKGCKTVVVYSPVPLAGWWEANRHDDKGTGQKAFELGANIIAYATGLEAPRPRMSRVEVASDKKEPVRRGFLQVGQLKHGGDWQPAPKAMRNLMAEARKTGLDVVLTPVPLFTSDEGVVDHRFLYMHGRKKFEAKREDLKHLRFALRSGSMLLADACCGAKDFDASFRDFVEELFGDDKLKLEPVPVDDRLYSEALNGEEIKAVKRREGKELKTAPPALEGVRWKGRWVILYSKWDIGCALEKHASPECQGHDYDSAARLGKAAVLYSLTR